MCIQHMLHIPADLDYLLDHMDTLCNFHQVRGFDWVHICQLHNSGNPMMVLCIEDIVHKFIYLSLYGLVDNQRMLHQFELLGLGYIR